MKRTVKQSKHQGRINQIMQQSEEIIRTINTDGDMHKRILKIVDTCAHTLKKGGKVLFCGNGGSAADAQHLASELAGRFYFDRPPLNAEALHVNTSYLTAVANDYTYDEVFSRLVRAKGRKGDVLMAISTSGNSKNVLNALKVAREMGIVTVGLTGRTGGMMKDLCTHILHVPSDDTPRIQESHIMLGHIICELVESKMFPG
jgi:D-sedoheptulose 7-phosphate isomerase